MDSPPTLESLLEKEALIEIMVVEDRIVIRFDRPLQNLDFSLEQAEGFARAVLGVVEEVRRGVQARPTPDIGDTYDYESPIFDEF